MSETLCPKCNYGHMVALFMSGPVCSHDCDRNPVPKRKPTFISKLQEAVDAELKAAAKAALPFVPTPNAPTKTSRTFLTGQYVLVSSLPGPPGGTVIALDHTRNRVMVSFHKLPDGWFDPKELI